MRKRSAVIEQFGRQGQGSFDESSLDEADVGELEYAERKDEGSGAA